MIININKSYILASLGLLVYAMAGLILLRMDWPRWLQALLRPMLLLIGWRQIGTGALMTSKRSIVQLGLKESVVDVYLQRAPEVAIPCRVGRCFVSSDLVAARLHEPIGMRRHNLFVVRHMCSQEDFRRLKRLLRAHAARLTVTASP